MASHDVLKWVRSQLHTAVIKDVSKDFSDGTVLMELAVLLVKNESSVSEALESFTQKPTSVFQSLANIKGVLTCLQADGVTCESDIKPLDVFRGRSEVILELLGRLRSKYDSLLTPMNRQGTLSKQDITNWARTVCEHTDGLRKESGESHNNLLSDHSDHDTGFIDHAGSAGSDIEDHKQPIEDDKDQYSYPGDLLPDPRPQDESYSNVDVIEVDEKLVRADTKIVLSAGSNRRACVYVSIPMRYEVIDLVARETFINQASRNYVLSGCEVPTKGLSKLGLGYTILLATCSYSRSLRTQSVGIYSPFLLGLQTINMAETKQLFAHVLRGRVELTVTQKPDQVKVNMKNVTKKKILITIPEGTVWQQEEFNGDSHVVTRDGVVRELYPQEVEIISIPALYLNRNGGKSRGLGLYLSPFVFRGPMSDQEKLFSYSDPGDDGYFRFCNSCNSVIYPDMYGVMYFHNRPYHIGCGPSCLKCGLVCLNLHLKDEQPYCSLECCYLSSSSSPHYCLKCGYVLPDGDARIHKKCPRLCRVCDMVCLDDTMSGAVCSQLCQDWDTSKNVICQGCAQPILRKSTAIQFDRMNFHSTACLKIRTTSPPLILQRAMVRGRGSEVTELRRLSKVEFEKRTERRRDALRLKTEECERSHKLDNVMDCINKIEAFSDHTHKKFTTQPRKHKHPGTRDRTRSLGSADSDKTLENLGAPRKRANLKQPDSISIASYSSMRSGRSNSETGSFLDLLFSSDDDDTFVQRPCRRQIRTQSETVLKSARSPVEYEKRRLNRGFPTGDLKIRPAIKSRERLTRAESPVSHPDTMLILPGTLNTRSTRRFLSLKRSASKGSSGSTTSSSASSPGVRMEFERPDLFEQLRCEKPTHPNKLEVQKYVKRYGRHNSAPSSLPAGRTRCTEKYEASGAQLKKYYSDPPQSKRAPIEPDRRRSPTKRSFSNETRSPNSRIADVVVHSRSDKKRPDATSPFQSLLNTPTKPALTEGTDPLAYYMTPTTKKDTVQSPTRPILTEAQLRYERRFPRDRSRSVDYHVLKKKTSLTTFGEEDPTHHLSVTSPDTKYSLEILISPADDHKETWTAPRLHNHEAPSAYEMGLINTITLPGSTDLMEVGDSEPAVGVRLGSGRLCSTIENSRVSLDMMGLEDRRKSDQTVV